jgi:hypothetical protein
MKRLFEILAMEERCGTDLIQARAKAIWQIVSSYLAVDEATRESLRSRPFPACGWQAMLRRLSPLLRSRAGCNALLFERVKSTLESRSNVANACMTRNRVLYESRCVIRRSAKTALGYG